MKGIKQIGSVVCTAMAVFLFSYSVTLSLAAPKDFPQLQHNTFSKSGQLPVNPDAQFPFEEKDEEPGDEFQDSFTVVFIPADILSFVATNGEFDFIHPNQGPDNIITRVPIYLAQRALII